MDRGLEIGAEKQAIDNSCFKDSVFPFDDLNNITFDGAFFIYGSVFCIITIIDGYFFKDPIPGYGKCW